MNRMLWIVIALALILTITSGGVQAAEPGVAPEKAQTDVFDTPADKDSMLTRYFERLTAPQHVHFSSLAEWKIRRKKVRKRVLQVLGLDPLPKRLPLKISYGGSLNRGDYTIRRVYFQTWPDIYASGWLYIPKSPGKHPAVLNPHGHWPFGATDPVVQMRCIGLVKKGYVALTVDVIHNDLDAYLIGVNTGGTEIWNLIRGLDFLVSLPQVDSDRIGCTGASGGGMQTLYMMAVDDRIKVAVPAVYVTYFRSIMWAGEEKHCICNHVPGVLRYTDEPEIAATFAPRPALYLCVDGDWTKLFPTNEYTEIKSIYALYDVKGSVDVRQWHGSHGYSQPMREQMYAWFNKYLMGITDLEAAREPQI